MARILFLPYSHQLGTTYGLVDLATQFKNLGDEIIFAGEGKFLNYASAAGFKVIPLIEVDFKVYREFVDRGNLTFHNEKSIRQHVKAELELYERVKPDLIISQGRTTVALSAQIAKIKLINVSIAFLTKYYGLKVEMPETFSAYFLTQIPIIGKIINNNTHRFVQLKAKMSIKPYNKILKEYGHKPFETMYDVYAGNMLTLIPENSDLFPLNKNYPKDKYIFTGPLLTNNHYQVPDWYNETKEKDGNFIYLSMGSSSDKLYPQILKRLVEIYRNKKNFYIITNSCFLVDLEKIKLTLPDNFFITDTAPAQIMLELADLTICHGGKGTIYHSLIEGVPIFGIPQQAEQEINLKRIKELNLGDYLLASKLKSYSNQRLETMINRILFNKRIKNKVLSFSNKIRTQMTTIDLIVKEIHNKIN
ncbi:MAG: glycosyltransferase [bacterium]